MHGEWKVASNVYNDVEKEYAVYRLIDRDEVDHAGNRQYGSYYYKDRRRIEALAENLNKHEAGLSIYKPMK